MIVAVYPGTFDPITFGHMDIVRRALRICDKLVIGVAQDTAKSTLFSFDERISLASADIESMPASDSARCEVHGFTGLLVDYVRSIGASVIIRGLRAVSDFEYEVQMACLNHKLASDIETIFLPASDTTQFISSRFIRQIARLGGDVSPFVSPSVKKELERVASAKV